MGGVSHFKMGEVTVDELMAHYRYVGCQMDMLLMTLHRTSLMDLPGLVRERLYHQFPGKYGVICTSYPMQFAQVVMNAFACLLAPANSPLKTFLIKHYNNCDALLGLAYTEVYIVVKALINEHLGALAPPARSSSVQSRELSTPPVHLGAPARIPPPEQPLLPTHPQLAPPPSR